MLVETIKMIKCYLCHKEISDEITEYEETTITITSKACDDCLKEMNKEFMKDLKP